MQTAIYTTIIIAGAVIMLVSIVRSGRLLGFAPYIAERSRRTIVRMLKVHRILMTFFFIGYAAVATTFILRMHVIGEFFVSIIFFVGSAFVLMGILVQSRMLFEIQSTIHGIVPLCARCRRVRPRDADANDRAAWRSIEDFVEQATDADFSQGYCPDCLDKLYGLEETN